MFVVTRVPFDRGMCSGHPTTAHGTDTGILGENFRQSVRELAAHCSNSNIVFGAHGLNSDTDWNCHMANRQTCRRNRIARASCLIRIKLR